MGSYANIENFTSMAMPEGKTTVNYPLTGQGSIYSMTFDELQTMGSLGRDIGSLNMEELLKNLWTAEEIQANSISTIGGGSSSCYAPPYPSGNLQRQGSLTLPGTMSQKTVDDVWKELLKENGSGGVGLKGESCSDNRFLNMFQSEPTLGEITLEEFLSRAGVFREEIQPFEKPSNNGSSYLTGFGQDNGLGNNSVITNTNGLGNNGIVTNTNGFTINFQQPSPNKGMVGNHYKGYNNNDFSFNLELNGTRAMSPPRLPNASLNSPRAVTVSHNGMANIPISGMTNSVVSMANPLNFTNPVNHNNGIMNIASSVVTNSVKVANSPRARNQETSSKNSLDSPTRSSSPYAYNEGGQGRRSSTTLDKQVERRRRRMIKNRESAARSRARKQEYITELEEEIAKLKEINRGLKEKQVELMNMQKNQEPESGKEVKRRRLRRTMTGQW